MNKEAFAHRTHVWGRIWNFSISFILLAAPFAVVLLYNCKIDWEGFVKAFVPTALLYYTIGAIEFTTYFPLLGPAGAYVSFVTGNIANLKLPIALNCLDQSGYSIKSEEGELVSTISICVSSITTMVIIAIGVFLMMIIEPFQEFLNNPVIAPAFAQVIPALFGGLAVVFISKNVKIAMAPCLLMTVIFILLPLFTEKYNDATSLLCIVGAVFTICISRVMYKKGILN